MKCVVTFLLLAFATGTVLADACTSYYDAEGIKRYNCDPEKSAAAFIADMEARSKSSLPDVVVHWPNDEVFVVHDQTHNVVKICRKMSGWVNCY